MADECGFLPSEQLSWDCVFAVDGAVGVNTFAIGLRPVRRERESGLEFEPELVLEFVASPSLLSALVLSECEVVH